MIIIRLAVLEYQLQSKMSNCISKTVQLYNRRLILSIQSLNVNLYNIKNRYI